VSIIIHDSMNVFIKQEGLIVIDVFFYYELCSFVIFIVSWNCTNKVIQWSCVHPISFDYINHLFTLYAQVLHHWNLMIQTPHHNYYPKQIISMIQMLETLLSRHIIVIIAVTIHNDGVHGFNDQSIICVYIYTSHYRWSINQLIQTLTGESMIINR